MIKYIVLLVFIVLQGTYARAQKTLEGKSFIRTSMLNCDKIMGGGCTNSKSCKLAFFKKQVQIADYYTIHCYFNPTKTDTGRETIDTLSYTVRKEKLKYSYKDGLVTIPGFEYGILIMQEGKLVASKKDEQISDSGIFFLEAKQ